MSYSCQVPVALIFFNRPETFKRVFEKVREAKPRKLYLIQDGARNENDIPKIEECRKIAEDIDWECEVVKDYSEVNLGCGVRPQSGITNVLKTEESVIILEDDCIPANSFFPYCEELLEKYKDDERICYISGLNHFEEWDCGKSDYFFTKTGAIWGWATWQRAWSKNYDYFLEKATDEDLIKASNKIPDKVESKKRLEAWRKVKEASKTNEKLSYWDVQWGFVKFSKDMLVIVPRVNQICNIGIGQTSTHAAKLKKEKFVKYKNYVYIPTHQLDFPITHPQDVVCNVAYDNLLYKSKKGNIIKRILKKLTGR